MGYYLFNFWAAKSRYNREESIDTSDRLGEHLRQMGYSKYTNKESEAAKYLMNYITCTEKNLNFNFGGNMMDSDKLFFNDY